MKFIAWTVGALFAVWLVAFVGIKIYDLGCVASPSICIAETGIWLRKLVLLEWASKWQTLISGLCALLAGGFVLLAAKAQIRDSHAKHISEQRKKITSDIFNAFHSIVQLGPIWKAPFEEKTAYVEQAIEMTKVINHFCAELTLDINFTLFQLRINNRNFNDENKAYILCYTQLLGRLSSTVDSHPGYPERVLPSELRLDYDDMAKELADFGLSIEGLDRIKKYCLPRS